MGNPHLSSKTVLILATESQLSLKLRSELQKECSGVELVTTVHQAMIQAIFREPDIILIELSPNQLSGLRLLEEVRSLKGTARNPRFILYADRRMEESLRHWIGNILFLDGLGSSSMLDRLGTALEAGLPAEMENIPSWGFTPGRTEAWPDPFRERNILEKLGKMGILKKG